MSKIENYISRFITNYQYNIESIVKNALLLKEARVSETKLTDSEWNTLQKRLNLTYRITQIITKIGKNKILTNEKYFNQLPPSIYKLYELTRASEKKLLELLQNKKINPSLSYDEIIKLVGLEKSQKLNDKKKVNTLRFLNIRIDDKKFRLKDLTNIKKDILSLISKHKNSTELTLEDYEVEKRLRLQKELVFIKFRSDLRMSDKKDYKKIFDNYKEQFEKLGKDTLEESKKILNTY
jgi:hypothetical protein